ncbi:tRNA (adenosine(37)-N6)-threonylcarbamoyltransferase complex dimerization subunit type 1 TsaB [Rhodovulum adriaticum]|uniref:tRNA threonylcarbamoyl adenosine modification protein YeaZ n=1 Tax=Rhodovulum adriaticum TaxID=35804 RepID=A0A4R2NWS0_RHOAD|nr:tRNA (adenosine(37)-N6)-threonylcarbamoyltransferase complex dimerization subunit type 1 TsaB [Rhodovulum adriaticum]MBK1636983.1 tRNA (adenosine(37)-N6)-threonylcarbamoyltransferase complex dimerization subunit type 1 TsaB [Rhodovulum adriaticum]TCP26540.1 tRNA threonylcarbamoyl adenosine modification protein YeaZ [Rhodovulum adriaticum]
MTAQTILAFDTSAAHCAAALLRGDTVIASDRAEMSRGQAEALVPLLERLMAQGGCGWADLDALGVGIGPGNFTGIRISVALARGLSLALGVPAIGVSGFAALAEGEAGALLLSLPAPRDGVYLQAMSGGDAQGDPVLASPEAPPTGLAPAGARVIGHAADRIGAALGLPAQPRALDDIAPRIARVAARRLGTPQPRPAPLYIRPADAAPPADPPPAILP